MSNRAGLLAAATFATREISVAGQVVRVREFNARDGIEFSRLAAEAEQAKAEHGDNSPAHVSANLNMLQFAVMVCVVDDQNQRILSEADAALLDDMSVETIATVATAAIDLTYGETPADLGNVA